MTPEEIQIAIVEACGWKEFPHPNYKKGILLPYKWSRSATEHLLKLPDYPNDINACFEMEEMLTPEQKKAYRKTLADICRRDGNIFATAGQRCEAFLRTVGLWRE